LEKAFLISGTILFTFYTLYCDLDRPENADAWNNLGIAYFRLSRHNDAIEAFRQTIRIDPKNPVAWSGVGTVYALTN
jgi:cytochrome c-type biogenesis protein CcmH/NrfG